jgi:hypothetical protein
LPTLQCTIESLAEWYPRLFLEPHIVACVGLMSEYSEGPAQFEVECRNIASAWLEETDHCTLEISWLPETVSKAYRLRSTVQRNPLVEAAAVAVALVLTHQMLRSADLDVTRYGERADYRFAELKTVLEISGTESISELKRRHRRKVKQAIANPLGWDALVAVCAFSRNRHRILFSRHRNLEASHGES